MQSIIFIKTVKDYYSLTLTFMIPDQRPHLDTQPAFMISHFLGHEGPGSVYAYLKKKNWLISISAGAEWRNPSVQQLKVSVRLTKEGYGGPASHITLIIGQRTVHIPLSTPQDTTRTSYSRFTIISRSCVCPHHPSPCTISRRRTP